jgi:hypothetical protein
VGGGNQWSQHKWRNIILWNTSELIWVFMWIQLKISGTIGRTSAMECNMLLSEIGWAYRAKKKKSLKKKQCRFIAKPLPLDQRCKTGKHSDWSIDWTVFQGAKPQQVIGKKLWLNCNHCLPQLIHRAPTNYDWHHTDMPLARVSKFEEGISVHSNLVSAYYYTKLIWNHTQLYCQLFNALPANVLPGT